MAMCVKLLLASSVLLLSADLSCGASRILAIIPTQYYAHQVVFRQLWKQLSLRGHQVTLVTTHPMRDPTLLNLTEIDMSFLTQHEDSKKTIEILGDGTRSLYDKSSELLNALFRYEERFYRSPQIQDLLDNETWKFDLLITEALYPTTVAFSWRFRCPWIGVSSLDVNLYVQDALGNPSHPVLTPDYNAIIEDYDDLSLKERIDQVIFTISTRVYMKWFLYPVIDASMRKYFGDELPSVEGIMHNMSMMFLNTNPIIHNVRPLNPNTLVVGSGIHIEAPKKLPSDIRIFLDDAKEGAIYFSLGSNIHSNLVKGNLREIFIEAFRDIPYRVLWRYDVPNMNISENVKVKDWLPQHDILRHPNIKLFITQGGLQSLEETLCFGVPILGIPFFGDQFHNVRKAVKLGIGLEMPVSEIDVNPLKQMMNKIIENPRYQQRAKELGQVLQDRPMNGVEEAVWWTEYVLRHKGAKHLRNAHANIPIYQYFMLDVAAVFLVILSIVLSILYLIVKLCIRILSFVCKKKQD